MTHARPPGDGRRYPEVRRALEVVGWLVLAGIAGSAFFRLTHLDGWTGGIILSALAPVTMLAAYPVLGIAAWRRRRAATVVAALEIGLHLWWFAAMLPVIHEERGLPRGAVQLRAMTANLLFTNDAAGGLAGRIADLAPDIIGFDEFSHHNEPGLSASGVLQRYPFSLERPTWGADGIALFSKLPLRDAQEISLAGQPALRAEVVTANGPVTVIVAHTVAPIEGSHAAWAAELHALAPLVRAVRGPVLVLGDLNATLGNRPYADLLATGRVHDVLDATGSGYAMTWPVSARLPFPLVRPDHVLYGHGLVALRGHTEDVPGSDHRAVVADVGVRG